MHSKSMFAAGAILAAFGLYVAGVATGSSAEAANPATVTIRYLSDGSCGSIAGTKNAGISSTSIAMSGVRGCVATFRVVR